MPSKRVWRDRLRGQGERLRFLLAGAGTTRIYGVKSDSYIFGHGDIVTEGCSWALFCQLAAVS